MSEKIYNNSGVVGNISSEVTAIGNHSHAEKNVNVQEGDRQNVIRQLRDAVSKLDLQPSARDIVDAEIETLGRCLDATPVDPEKVESHVQGLSDKLKMVGVLVGSVATIAEPLNKILGLVHLPSGLF